MGNAHLFHEEANDSGVRDARFGDLRPKPQGGARHWIVVGGEHFDDRQPELDAWAAEIAAEIAAAVRADRQDVWEQVAAAVERGEKGYIPVRHSTAAASERQARWLEEITPLMAVQSSKLREKVGSLGLTAEEESLLSAAELWLHRFDRESAGGQDA